MEDILRLLMEDIDQRWGKAGNSSEAFARVSADALRAFAGRFDIESILTHVVEAGIGGANNSGAHVASGVVSLVSGPRYALCLHTWLDDLVGPHSHGWNGAYQVLRGTSVQAQYRFEESSRFDAKFRFGVLSQKSLKLLRPGDTVPVELGPRTIHGLSYVETPGFAISVRSLEKFGELTLDYWGGVCLENEFMDDETVAKTRSLNALWAIDPKLCVKTLERTLKRVDMRTGFLLLRHSASQIADRALLERPRALYLARMGSFAPLLDRALVEIEHDANVRLRRQQTRDLEQRLLLSLLYLAPDRKTLHRVVRALRPKREPSEFIGRCIRDMARQPGAENRSILGTPMGQEVEAVLGLLLEDSRLETLPARVFKRYQVDNTRAQRTLMKKTAEGLRQMRLLRPVFS